MELRGITEQMVEEAIASPDNRDIGRGGKRMAFKNFKAGTIKVVFVEESFHTIVITIVWHKKNHEN